MPIFIRIALGFLAAGTLYLTPANPAFRALNLDGAGIELFNGKDLTNF